MLLFTYTYMYICYCIGYFANMDWEPANLFYLQCLCEVYNILLNDPKGIHILHHTLYILYTYYIYSCDEINRSYVHTLCTLYVHSLIHTLLWKSCNY